MKNQLKGRDLLSIEDLSAEEISYVMKTAETMKNEWKTTGRHAHRPLEGKSVALFFEKQSLRTRVSFEVGTFQLGGHPVVIYASNTHAGRGETLDDMARVFERYVSGIVYRSFLHTDIVHMAENCKMPVINALSDLEHPCQSLADLLTIYEKRGRDARTKVAYIGDANNVANSLMILFPKMGIDFSIACPESYAPEPALLARTQAYAAESGAKLEIVRDPKEAVKDANIVYTDVWVSMGQEEEEKARCEAFDGYLVDAELMAAAAPDALFMHDLPAHRGLEVTDEVIDGSQSVIFDQAENRLHVQKALLALLMGD